MRRRRALRGPASQSQYWDGHKWRGHVAANAAL
ncbi:DUF2510 domain-containing protein [Sphingopyxis sp. DHUNG17]|nr:DUF2510 domain-containing protein [Sphingopyxis lutea]